MPITTDLATEVGQLRLLIGDTEAAPDGVKPDGSNYTDEELQFFIDGTTDTNIAAAMACETLAWLWNTQASFEADGLRVDRHKVSQGWWRAAVRFRANRGARLVPVTRRDAFSDRAVDDAA